MTTIIKPAMQSETVSLHTESPIISLEQRFQAEVPPQNDSGLPLNDNTGEIDNLALCRQYITHQIMMDMVKKENDEREWQEKWF